MNDTNRQQADLELARARKALLAASVLYEHKLYEDCVSRAYYAVLHAARAALATCSVFPKSHTGTKRLFGLHLVKEGLLEKHYAVILTAEQEDREMGDYGIGIEFSADRAQARLEEAQDFVHHIERFVGEA